MKHHNTKGPALSQVEGFTLIETIIYMALFAIIIGGGMVATYQIVEGTNAAYNHVVLQEEANFLFRKIEWALTGATAVAANGTQLQATKGLFLRSDFDLDVNNMTLQVNRPNGADPLAILNSSSIAVSNLLFTDIPAANGRPQGVTATFTLTTAQNGRPATQDFTFTKYLRN